jgi:hypothetical protein
MPQAVETIIARCLIEPGLLGKPGTPNALLDFDQANLEKIRRFAGFICKVKHNHLWGLFPATRRLISHYGIEFGIFTKYRLEHDAPTSALSLAFGDPILNFVNFLEAHFCSHGKAHPYRILTEVLRHERLLWETRLLSASMNVKPALLLDEHQNLQWSGFQRLVVRLDETLRLSSFHYDVQSIASQLTDASIRDKFTRGPERFLAYYLDRTGDSVRVVEVDRITAHLLSLINGRCSVRRVIAVARSSGLKHARPMHFREFFEEAHRFGFINFLPERT